MNLGFLQFSISVDREYDVFGQCCGQTNKESSIFALEHDFKVKNIVVLISCMNLQRVHEWVFDGVDARSWVGAQTILAKVSLSMKR